MVKALTYTTLTPEQVAQYLQLNRETVYNYIKRGELSAAKLGRHYRVTQESLTKFLMARSTDAKYADALWERFMAIGERNRDIPEDEVQRDVEEAIREVRKAY